MRVLLEMRGAKGVASAHLQEQLLRNWRKGAFYNSFAGVSQKNLDLVTMASIIDKR